MIRRRRRISLALAAGLVLCMGMTASADKHGYEINPEAMKELEEASTFEVRVTEKKVVEECLDTESMDYNDDVLILTVTNGSDKPVKAVKVKYAAYDDKNITTEVASSKNIVFSMGDAAHEIFSVESGEDEIIEPGGTCEFVQAVNFSLFSGVRAMVAEYVLEDGTVVSNPDYPNWENMAFGLDGGNVTELD